jgi:hypothetical protein
MGPSVYRLDSGPERIGPPLSCVITQHCLEAIPMNSIIYLVGLVVIVMAILSFIGLA